MGCGASAKTVYTRDVPQKVTLSEPRPWASADVNAVPPGRRGNAGISAVPPGCPPLHCDLQPAKTAASPRPASGPGKELGRSHASPISSSANSSVNMTKMATDDTARHKPSGAKKEREVLLKLGGERPGDVNHMYVEDTDERGTAAVRTKSQLRMRLPSVVALSSIPAQAVGIDLGSTYSCVAAFNDSSDQLEIITNEHGVRQTPSYVAFTGEERLVGNAAMDQVTRNPRNTVFHAKHLTKRKFSDQAVRAYIETLPYQVTRGSDDEPIITVTYKGVQQKFNPTEISAMILTKLKFITERYLERQVYRTVITVPFYFSDRQRQATKDAAFVAGFQDVTLLNETTAAAVAYVHAQRHQMLAQNKEQTLLVLHVGRGACDASLLKVTDRSCRVQATSSHAPDGGLDFDRQLVEFCKEKFKERNEGKDISDCLRALQRLRDQCERVKRLLSSSTHAVIEIDSLFNGIDFSLPVSRDLFEDLNRDLLQEVIVPIAKVLQEASMDRRDVDDVLLVGGSVRIPRVQALVREFFHGKELCMTVDPSEAVALGAAVYASCLASQNDLALSEGFDSTFSLRHFSITDVMPSSLGIETSGGKMTTLVPRSTVLPHECERLFTVEHEKQASVVIRAFEGEAAMVKDNHCLGILHLETRQTKMPKSDAPRIKVQFRVNADGILSVTAEDMLGKTVRSAKLRKGVFSASEVKEMIQDAELFAQEDVDNRERIKARNVLEHSCYKARAAIADYRGKEADSPGLRETEQQIQDILDWLDFGDPLLHVAAELKQRFPKYSFGYDGQTLANDAPLRKLETPLKESRRGYREALESITERDTLQVLSEMDCERSYRGKLLTDSTVSKLKQQVGKGFQTCQDDLFLSYNLQDFEPDPLRQEQHIVAELMRVAGAAQEELRQKLAAAEHWSPVPGKPNHFECTDSVYADLVRDPGIKSEERVRQKANAKYRPLLDLRFARVRDIARFSLSYDTLEGLLDGLQRLRQDFKVVELENRFAKPTALGWRDVTLLIQMQVPAFCTSHIAEIQMSHRSLVQARQRLHKHWKLVRELLPGTCKVAADDMDEVQDIILNV